MLKYTVRLPDAPSRVNNSGIFITYNQVSVTVPGFIINYLDLKKKKIKIPVHDKNRFKVANTMNLWWMQMLSFQKCILEKLSIALLPESSQTFDSGKKNG